MPPPAFTPAPLMLEGTHVRLEPLTRDHVERLCEIGRDPSLWQWTPSQVRTCDDMRAYVETALAQQAQGTAVPFATMEKNLGLAVGSTRFGNVVSEHRRVEIGWTWIAPPWQRTAVNTEAKYLMLRHAFDVWNCLRVELKTDALNTRSRRAIERLGAVEEGVLRQHVVNDSGRVRDTVYYSILADEWPTVKARLEDFLRNRN